MYQKLTSWKQSGESRNSQVSRCGNNWEEVKWEEIRPNHFPTHSRISKCEPTSFLWLLLSKKIQLFLLTFLKCSMIIICLLFQLRCSCLSGLCLLSLRCNNVLFCLFSYSELSSEKTFDLLSTTFPFNAKASLVGFMLLLDNIHFHRCKAH